MHQFLQSRCLTLRWKSLPMQQRMQLLLKCEVMTDRGYSLELALQLPNQKSTSELQLLQLSEQKPLIPCM